MRDASKWYGVMAVGIVLIAVGVVRGDWVMAAGLDFWNVPALEAQIQQYAEERAEMDAESEAVNCRIAVKDAITTDLIAGQVTLATALDQFSELNKAYPDSSRHMKDYYPTCDGREGTARSVLSFAAAGVEVESPQQKVAVLTRLQAEFKVMFPTGTTGLPH